MKNLPFKQYRNIDLFLFGFLLIFSETITTLATNKWFYAQPIAISTTFVFICIMMMRWSGFAAIHATVGGLVFCIASGAKPHQYLIYIVGNCLALVAMLWFKLLTKEKIRKTPSLLVTFTISAYLLMQIGRWVVSLFFSGTLNTLLTFVTTDSITLLFAIAVMILMRKVDGIIEDQKTYLFRLQREREESSADLPDLEHGDEEII